MPEELKAKIMRLMEEGYNKGNLAVFDELVAPNCISHHPTNPQKDLESLKKFVAVVLT